MPFTDILNMICSCVDNSSPDRYVLLHIGYSFPIRFLVLPVYVRNNVQYHSASVEGASYLRGIHKVQRYVSCMYPSFEWNELHCF
jgi:hypothetical protein